MSRRAFVLALLLTAGGPAGAAELIVEVQGVRNDHGRVRVAVCTAETFLTADCPHEVSVPAARGTVAVPVTGVRPGTYALQSYHDENGNAHFDRGFLGIPEEGIGFGNDAPIYTGPPGFERASIEVREPRTVSHLRLRYFQGESGPAD